MPPTAAQIQAANARLPLISDGISDGGSPYTHEEMLLMFRKELAHELQIPIEELE